MRIEIFVRRAAAALTAALLFGALAQTAAADDRSNQITVGGSLRADRVGSYLIYMHNFSGNLKSEGMLIRLSTGNGVEVESDDSSLATDLLAGYQFQFGDWRVRAFGGVTYVTDVEQIDAGTLGLKTKLQVDSSRSGELYTSFDLGYGTVRNQLQGSVRIAGHVAGILVGPELGFIASDEFSRVNLGLYATGIKLDALSLSMRAGYSFHDSGDTEQSGPYAGASATLQF